jgi:hypothetical protein
LGVVDTVPLPPSLLALMERHVHPVSMGPLIGIDDHGRSTHVVLRPWRRREVAERHGGGGEGVPDLRQRDDELAAPSFFAFFSHNVARLWRCGNGGSIG